MFIRILSLALLLGGGCAGRAVSPFEGLDPRQARALARQMDQAREAELAADLRTAFATRSPRNVLVLSGGDADGAFGCGVLRRWREAPGGRDAEATWREGLPALDADPSTGTRDGSK